MRSSAASEKIYVRETTGWHTRWRWVSIWVTQLVFFGLPWLTWNDRPMVLFDWAAQKFYVFAAVGVPQDLVYLAVMLIICACGLFLLSAMVGRVWCGFGCPHTVYSEIFLWIERRIEGGRSARMRLDAEAWSAQKFRKKALKHGVWLAVALWIGVTFVGYFTPIRALVQDGLAMALSLWPCFWIAAYGGLAYVNAGWMREQICRHICPYARFQSAMLDRDSLVIAYDPLRGEPRGLRNRKSAAHNRPQGDCIDCTLCVQVCPTGTDIRQGLQYDCMGCAACIDACDRVMDKIGAARGLIRYTPLNAIGHPSGVRAIRWRLARPRILIYAGMLVAMGVALGGALNLRAPLKLNVVRDRGALLQESASGLTENVYQLHIVNTDERAHRYRIMVSGMGAPTLVSADAVSLDAATSRVVPVRVSLAPGQGRAGSNPIVFELQDQDDANLQVTQKAVFLVPHTRAHGAHGVMSDSGPGFESPALNPGRLHHAVPSSANGSGK